MIGFLAVIALLVTQTDFWSLTGLDFGGDFETVDTSCSEPVSSCSDILIAVRVSLADYEEQISPQIETSGFTQVGFIPPMEGGGPAVNFYSRQRQDSDGLTCTDSLTISSLPVRNSAILTFDSRPCVDMQQ